MDMDKRIISRAIKALSKGELVVYPTDTLYGLGADIFNESAVKKVYHVKNRPIDNPLSIAVSCVDEIENIAYVNEQVFSFAKKFLPGVLTIVLKKKKIVPDIVTGGLDNIAIRIPDNRIAIELLSSFGPLTCTSANAHGKKTPALINEIIMQFKQKDIAVFIDDGRLNGKPSTIVDLTKQKPKIIREGDISKKQIMDAIKDG